MQVDISCVGPSPSLSWGSYIVSALPPVSGVILGAILAFFYTFYLNVRTSRNDVLKDFHSDLDRIEKLCSDYWLGNYQFTDEAQKKAMEAIGHQLRAKLAELARYRETTRSLFSKKNYDLYYQLDLELFLIATGGEFQTEKMNASPETYNKILDIVSDMRSLIRTTRGRFFN